MSMNNLTLLEDEATIDLTTLARVKALCDPNGTTTWKTNAEAVINNLIDLVSRRAMTDIMHRGVKSASRTEYFDIMQGQREIYVLGSPIDTSSTITIVSNSDQPRDYSDSDDEIDAKYYYPSNDGTSNNLHPANAKMGRIYFETSLTAGPQTLKVTYTGGMAATTTAFLTAYPDIAAAIDEQVADMYKRSINWGATTEGIIGASFTFESSVNWLVTVRQVLQNHARSW